MNLQRKTLRQLLKNRKAISQVLAAVLMLFLFVAAIALVWGWLYPTYRRFQTQNAINSVTTYMLGFDEGIYELFGEGVGSTNTYRADPIYGSFQYEVGKNLTFIFSDATGAFNETFNFNELGMFTYLMENRRGVMLDVGEHNYLKGPNSQRVFFCKWNK